MKRFLFSLMLLSSPAVMAEETAMNAADVSWMLVATTLVLFMTIPGIALFYAGMVRKKMCFRSRCRVLRFAAHAPLFGMCAVTHLHLQKEVSLSAVWIRYF